MGRTSASGRTNIVRSARRRAGLTQAELADQVDVARQTIVAVEAGDYAPSVFLALDVARVLSTSVEALFGPCATPDHTPDHTPDDTSDGTRTT